MGLLDLTNVAESGGTVPDGTYAVAIEKAEVADTKAGGKMIKVQLNVLEGPHTGRKIFNQFNIENANPQATQIGLGQLKSMIKAFGHKNPNRLESCAELLGLKGNVRVKIKDDPQYGAQANIMAFTPLAQSGPLTGAGPAPTPGQTPPGNPFS